MKLAIALLAVLVIGTGLYVRLAPTDPARWQLRPEMPEPGPGAWSDAAGFRTRVIVEGNPPSVLAALDALARATPRTRRIAGSPGEGLATYETRSALWGFPDYTTVAAEPAGTGTRLEIHARQRFGRKDFGVNRARVDGWLADLAP